MDHISQTRQILEGLSVEEGIIYTIETLRDVFAILRSWVYGAKDNPNVLLFGYENITGESAFQSFKRLYDHCNITISDALISQILDDYSFEKLSQGRKQGSEDQSSHYRKGLPGDWKNYFNSTIRSKFEEIAEDLVGDLGYEWDGLGVLGQPYQGIYGDFQEPVSHTSVQVSVENKVEQTLHAASETYQAGLLDVSLKQYQSVMEMLEPYLAPTYFYLGRIHHQKEQFELAVEAYKKAILINSELVDSYFFIAQILAKQGQAEQAIEYYQKFIDRKSDVPDVYFHLAILHYKQEQLDEAKKNFKTFLKLRPNAADAHFYLGGVYFKQGELERAMSCYRKSLENNPNLADSYFYMAEIHLKRGQVKRSMQLHNKYKAMKKLHS
jgi:tetratricopeptide (TPR) repeat protein